MNKKTACLAALLAAAVTAAMPLSANAQFGSNNATRAAPAAPRAAPAAPAARAPGGFQRSPSFNPGARMAAPHFSTNRFAGPRAVPNRLAAPSYSTRRFSSPNVIRNRGMVTRFGNNRTFNRSVLHDRTLQRQVIQPNRIRPNALSNARTNLRNARAGRIDPQLARQGRFGARFAQNNANFRGANFAAHRAWRRGLRAGFVPWYGPVFWPYAYSDVFDYAFWPYGYDDGFWDYAYDGFVDGVFWGEYGPPETYAYAPASRTAPRVSYASVQELCSQPGSGITAWPFADIEKKVGLNADQKQLLADLRGAASKAADVFKSSCPSQQAFPLTPPGRLDAMTARLSATLEAVEIVRPPLEKFYASLSDEQKERFNEIGPKRQAANADVTAALPDRAKTCGEAKPGLTNLPIEQIQNAVKPSKEQQANLDKLGEATVKGVGILQAACPDATPLTPTGRLEAMENRLKAMIEAANTVKEPLNGFYSSLSNEQKARFNRLGTNLAQSDD